MKYEIVKGFPNDILFERDDICISIYQPTHRHASGTQNDRILFKNQIQKAERSLEQKYNKREIEDILGPLYELEKDNTFWNKTKDGIAILMNRNRMVIYNLYRDIKELTVVSDSFHIKPLIRVFQSADKYYVLGVNRKTFKLYYGDRYGLRELEFPSEVPIKIEDVLGDQYTDSNLGGSGVSQHGYGSKKDEIEIDIEKYLRYVDRFVLENYSKPTGAPLLLVALDEYQGHFRKLSHNDFLIKEGISKDFESMSTDNIRKDSWEIIEKQYLEKTAVLVDMYEKERTKGLGSKDLGEIAKAAVENRVEMILIESDRIEPGKIDLETGKIIKSELENVDTDDVFDDIAELVFKTNGKIVMLPKERMPSDTGVAAVFRY